MLTWVHRITRMRRREQDLFGQWGSVWQVIRTSNGYRFLDPLERAPGRRSYVACKTENPARPLNREKKIDGARLDGARFMREEISRTPPEQSEQSEIALQREHGRAGSALLSDAERAALIARLDTKPTRADWDLWNRDLEARLGAV